MVNGSLPTVPSLTFDRREHWDENSDDDVTDLTDGAAGVTTDAAELDTGAQRPEGCADGDGRRCDAA